jgi:hypothetical protein
VWWLLSRVKNLRARFVISVLMTTLFLCFGIMFLLQIVLGRAEGQLGTRIDFYDLLIWVVVIPLQIWDLVTNWKALREQRKVV